MTRVEFTAKIKVAAWQRAEGCCEDCRRKIVGNLGPPQYDHIVPCGLGGKATLDNCMVLCVPCHGLKTSGTDVPRIAKAKRIERGVAGIGTRKVVIPGSRASAWKRKIDGTTVRRIQ